MKDKARKVLQALDAGKISEGEARDLLTRLKAKSQNQTPEFVEKSPKELGVIDRAIAESFGADQNAKLAYYKKKYPDSDPRLEGNNRITFKGEGNKRHYADPDAEGFDGIGEFSRDVLESVVPIGSGLIESAASGLGGLGGATVGSVAGPVGSVAGGLAGASAAGAGTAGLLEQGRQGIGSLLGIPNNQNQEEVDFARKFGAVSPLVFGFDKPMKLAKGPLKGLLKDAAKKEVVGKGLVGFGASAAKDRVFPAVAAMTSGKAKGSIKNLVKKYPKLAKMGGRSRIADLFSELEDKAQNLMSNKDAAAKKQFGEALDIASQNTGVGLNTTPILQPLKDLSNKVKGEFADDFRRVSGKMGISEVDQNSILSNYFSGGGKAKRIATSKVREIMADTPGYKDLKYVEKHVDGLVKSKEGTLVGKQALNLKDDLNKISGIKKSSEKDWYGPS